MKDSSLHLKIKLDIPPETAEYYRLLDRWENEGGTVFPGPEGTSKYAMPLQPGDSFQVIDGNICLEDNGFYYIVEIQKIDIQEPE